MKRVSRKHLIFLALILTLFSIVVIPQLVFKPILAKFYGAKEGRTYYCPMHPTYLSDRPGDCPICNMKLAPKEGGKSKKGRSILYYRHPMGQPDTSPVPKKDSMGMDYIPVYEDEAAGRPSTVSGYATVQITVEKQQLIGVKLGSVEKKKLSKDIRTVGRVVYDPELFVAQQEFISAVKSLERAEAGGPYHEPPERTRALIEAARTRLRILGMSQAEIDALERGDGLDRNLILPAAGSALMSSRNQFVWIYATIYEYELPFVKVGSPVKVIVPTYADREFSGEVRALDPILDPQTRSIRARIWAENPEGLLKPGMYADVYLKTDLGELLAVPKEAVMLTGEHAIVFVAEGDGFFEPRDVKVGIQAGDFYEIKYGVAEGERIVTSGNFLIDSESRLKGALEAMSAGGHQHGQ